MDKIIKIIIWPLIIAPAVYLAIVWNKLPEKIADNFDIQGNPDGYGNKNELIAGIAIMTILAVVIYIFLSLVYKIDAKKNAEANNSRFQRLAFAITSFICFVACIIINSAERGEIRFNIRLAFGGIGLMWCIIGNYMHSIKPNHLAGIRLPWTLKNEDNWRKTHSLGGKLFFAGGLLLVLISIFAPIEILVMTFVLIAIIITFIPCIYSYRLHKKQKTRN